MEKQALRSDDLGFKPCLYCEDIPGTPPVPPITHTTPLSTGNEASGLCGKWTPGEADQARVSAGGFPPRPSHSAAWTRPHTWSCAPVAAPAAETLKHRFSGQWNREKGVPQAGECEGNIGKERDEEENVLVLCMNPRKPQGHP